MRARRIPLWTEHGRLLAAVVAAAGVMAFSTLQAQVSQPSATDISPTVNTEISSVIRTGCGYDAWTGSVHRSVTDLEVPGAVSSLGLKWVRTYNSGNSSTPGGWNFSYTWRYWGAGWGGDATAVYLPDGGIWRTIEPGTKLRFQRFCTGGPPCGGGYAYLYLEDGSRVHMPFWVDPPECEQQPPRCYAVDHFTPDYVDDPYGRQTTLYYEEPCVQGHVPGDIIRLKQVTDPSGRWIRITYACDNPNDCSCDNTNWWPITDVTGSDGSSVHYTWGVGGITRVDYNRNTPGPDSAYYTYGDTTFLYQACCSYPDCNSQCWFTGHSTQLLTAQDTHADSPMQSIKYDYATADNGNKWQGAVTTERHLASNVAVSILTSYSRPGAQSATQTERRGDGPQRALYIDKGAQHVPLVKRKSDFNGINEVFTYDANNYLLTAKDRNNNTTTYTNEPVIGNPTQITHPDGTYIQYSYSDSANPYTFTLLVMN